jgi:hypothetical protein
LPRAKKAPPSTEDATTDELLTPLELSDWRTELTVELVDELVTAGMCGAMKQDVALSCGVPPDLFEAWLDEGLRYDAPPLMRRLAVQFLGSRKKLMVAISRHNPKWSRDAAQVEKENAAPELSLDVRYQLLVESFRRPRAEIRRAMLEAGITPPDAPASDSPEAGPADASEGS